MAKVTAPLMSMDASGTVGGAIVFSKWKGRNYVRTHVTPSNPQTAAQTAVRSMFGGLVQAYQANVVAIQSAFADRAAQQSISAFNAFLGFNQKRAAQGYYPADSTTPTNVAPANNATALAATVNNRYVSLSWVDAADANAWLFGIYRKLGADPTGVKAELVGVVARGSQQFEDGPLDPGTWHYRIRAISKNGGATNVSAAVTAVVA